MGRFTSTGAEDIPRAQGLDATEHRNGLAVRGADDQLCDQGGCSCIRLILFDTTRDSHCAEHASHSKAIRARVRLQDSEYMVGIFY